MESQVPQLPLTWKPPGPTLVLHHGFPSAALSSVQSVYVRFPSINGNMQGLPLLAKQVLHLGSVVGDDDIVVGVVNGEVTVEKVEIFDEGAEEADSDPTKKVNN